MNKILLPLTLIFFLSANGQMKKSVEVSIIGRYDHHANYISNFAGRVYNDTNKLYGMSYGLNIGYRQNLNRGLSAYFRVGYYRLGIDKIRGSMPFNLPGVRTGRTIHNDDDDSTRIGYSTTKYHYNNLAFTIGLSQLISVTDQFKFEVGAEGVGYYSFSQKYKLMNNYKYSTSNPKALEFGLNATVGMVKEYGKFYLRPTLLIPIYQNLKGDIVFDEARNMNISKWFNGIGLNIIVGKNI